MTIASVGTLGVGANAASNTGFTFNTATNSLAAGDFGILTLITDNASASDGDHDLHNSVSGGTGDWTKLGEYTNSGGAAAAGVTTSLWLFEATGAVATGTTITIGLASAVVDKCCSFWKFTKAAGQSIRLDPDAATNPIANEVNGTTGFGSVAFSDLPSAHRLYFRGAGKEANTLTEMTATANFTLITSNRSRNNVSAIHVRGEFRINTSTGETSNPTHGVSGDTAALFVALEEYTPAGGTTITGTGGLVAGDATASGAGKRTVTGTGGVSAITPTAEGAGTKTAAGGGGSTTQKFTDFDDLTTGALPGSGTTAEWRHGDPSRAAETWLVAADGANKYLTQTTIGTSITTVAMWDAFPGTTITDFELYSEQQTDTSNGSSMGIAALYANPGTIWPGYWLDANTNETVRLRKITTSGSTSVLASVTCPDDLLTNTPVKFLLRVDAGRVRAKVWLASNPEPETWLIDVTDGSPISRPLVPSIPTRQDFRTPKVWTAGIGINGANALREPASGGGPATITGTGAVTAVTPTAAGAGNRTVTGAGAVVATGCTLAGAGKRSITGTGAVTALTPTLSSAGAGVKTGTGALVALTPTAEGAGTQTPAAGGATTAYTNFQSESTGTLPLHNASATASGWRHTDPSRGNFTWEFADQGSGDIVLRSTTDTNTTAYSVARWETLGEDQDYEIFVKAKSSFLGNSSAMIWLGHDESATYGSNWAHYRLHFDTNSSTTELRLLRRQNGGAGEGQVATFNTSFTVSVNTLYCMVLRKQGSTVYGKMWPDGTEEPAGWQITYVDATPPAGPFWPGVITHLDRPSPTFEVYSIGKGSGVAALRTAPGGAPATITGTGAVTAVTPTLAGAGKHISKGSGTLLGKTPTLAGVAERTITATGAWLGKTPTLAGVSERSLTGTGALLGKTPSLAGEAERTVKGTGTLLGKTPTLTAAAKRTIKGTGAVAALTPTLAGVAERTVTGAGTLLGKSPTLAGEGTQTTGASTQTGAGALLARTPTLTGVAERTIKGTGAVSALTPTLAGEGNQTTGAATQTGAGALLAQPATLSGAGKRTVTGQGAVQPVAATLAGAGTHTLKGTGTFLAKTPLLAGDGDSIRAANADLAAKTPLVAGAGERTVKGTGTLLGKTPTISATTQRGTLATGTLLGKKPTLAGEGYVLSTVPTQKFDDFDGRALGLLPGHASTAEWRHGDPSRGNESWQVAQTAGGDRYLTQPNIGSGLTTVAIWDAFPAQTINDLELYAEGQTTTTNGSSLGIAALFKTTNSIWPGYWLDVNTDELVRLRKVSTSGSTSLVASAICPHNLSPNVRTKLLLRVDGARLRAKVWRGDQPEPETWLIDQTDATPVSRPLIPSFPTRLDFRTPTIWTAGLGINGSPALREAYGQTRNGEAVWVAPAATITGNATRIVPATAPLVAKTPTLTSDAEREVFGAGSVTATPATFAGEGVYGWAAKYINGAGDVSGPAASLAGTGKRIITGTAPLLPANPTLTSTSIHTRTGMGALLSSAAILTSAAKRGSNGAGALLGKTPTLTATTQRTTRATGAVTAKTPLLAGAGKRTVKGTGTLTAKTPTLAGTNAGGHFEKVAFLADPATLAGVGERMIFGRLIYVAGKSTLAGVGKRTAKANVQLVATKPTASGAGVVIRKGAGAVTAKTPVLAGTAKRVITGAADLITTTTPTMVGVWNRLDTLAYGNLEASEAQLLGLALRIITGQGEPTPPKPTLFGTSMPFGTGRIATEAESKGGGTVLNPPQGGALVSDGKNGGTLSTSKNGGTLDASQRSGTLTPSSQRGGTIL